MGYRKGYRHAINGVPSTTEDHGNAFTDVFFDLPGHNHPVSFLEPSEETYSAMYCTGIHEVKQLLEADERKLLTEYRLGQTKELIYQGETFTHIAAECGFQDYTSFFRTFKKEIGITPGEYAKNAIILNN